MADEASRDESKIPSGNLSLGNVVAGMVLILVLGLFGWTYFQKMSIQSDIEDADSAIASSEAELKRLQDEQLTSIIVAQQTISDVEVTMIEWSSVIEQLLDVTPSDVFYRSYTASNSGQVSLSVITDSYASAADLIRIIEDEENFGSTFASSLTQGSDEDGSDVVSFGVTFNVQ